MDVRRIALIAGLAVVTYLMVLNWSQDFSGAPTEQEQQSAETSSTGDVPAASAPDSATSSSGDDVPETATVDTPESTAKAATNDGSTVSLHSDVLNVRIKLTGGDIISATLPQYPVSNDRPDVPFAVLETGQRTYVAMSGLLGEDGVDVNGRAQYTVEQNRYEMREGQDELSVTLTHTADNGVVYKKIFTLNRGDYLIDVRYDIENNSNEMVSTNLFAQLKRDQSGDPSAGGSIGMASFLGVATTTPEDRYQKIDFGDMEDDPFSFTQENGWIAFSQHYFLSALVPPEDKVHNYYAKQFKNGFYYAGFQSPTISIEPGETGTTGTDLYVGPKDQDRLDEISDYLELTVDYGWLYWAAQPLFKLLQFMHGLVGNWGWAIVLMTLTVKMVLYPLTASSYRSMAKMRKFAPKMKELREQYGDDRQQLGQEMMKLYKKEKLNPMGGCLPILIQMPIFIALYWVLMEAVELRQSPFIFWIEDLSIKDPYFVLPLLMGASMFLQMQMQQQPGMDPMQQKMMKMMPIVFTFMFLWFPAGLTLYWFVNNVTTICQQWYVNRQVAKADLKQANNKKS